MKLPRVPLCVVFACLLASHANAGPIGVYVLESSFSTDLSSKINTYDYSFDDEGNMIEIHDLLLNQQVRQSQLPLHASIQSSATVTATGDADYFTIGTTTAAYAEPFTNHGSSYTYAFADSSIVFIPTMDTVADLTLDYYWQFFGAGFTDSSVTLTNLTTNQLLWSYVTDGITNNFGWTFDDERHAIAIQQSFSASHTYALTMHANSDANSDSEIIRVNLSGLHRVPEPGSWMLMGIGALAIGMIRQRRAHR